MANKQATGKKAVKGPELIQRSRSAVLGALDVIEQRGRTIAEILADEFEKNPLKFMELASKFCPKDMNIEANVVQTLTNDERIERIYRDLTARGIRESRLSSTDMDTPKGPAEISHTSRSH